MKHREEEFVNQGNVERDKSKPRKYDLSTMKAIRALRKGASGYFC